MKRLLLFSLFVMQGICCFAGYPKEFSVVCFDDGTCQTTAASGSGGSNIYPATSTANFPLGASFSTMTVTQAALFNGPGPSTFTFGVSVGSITLQNQGNTRIVFMNGSQLGTSSTFVWNGTTMTATKISSPLVTASTFAVLNQILDGNNSAGSATQVLTSNGAASPPTWQAVTAGGGSNIYPATGTASFPFGFSGSTASFSQPITISSTAFLNGRMQVSTYVITGGTIPSLYSQINNLVGINFTNGSGMQFQEVQSATQYTALGLTATEVDLGTTTVIQTTGNLTFQDNTGKTSQLYYSQSIPGIAISTNIQINGNLTVTGSCTGCGSGSSGPTLPSTFTWSHPLGIIVSTIDVTGSIAINDNISPHSYEISFGTSPATGFSQHTIGAETPPTIVGTAVAGSSITIQAGAGNLNSGNTHAVGAVGGSLYLNGGNAGNGGSLSTAANGGSIFFTAGSSGTVGNAAGVPGKIVFQSNVESHQSGLPSVSSCGTGSPAVTAKSTDRSGSVTTGTAATACTITFVFGFSNAPNCQVSGSSLVSFPGISSVSTTAVTFGISGSVTGDILYWSCEANQ